MTDAELIKIITEFMGWTETKDKLTGVIFLKDAEDFPLCSPYTILADLNLWHDKIEPRIVDNGDWDLYEGALITLKPNKYMSDTRWVIHASARDKAEALTKTIKHKKED